MSDVRGTVVQRTQSSIAALTASEPRTFAGFGRDLRVSWRSLRRDPVFAVLSLLTLAVGIGATTAIFTVVNAVLLRPLPYPAPDRLVALWQVTPASNRASVSIPNFRDWQTEARSFSAMATFRGSTTTVLGGDEPTRAEVFRVSGDFFRVLGANPALGRLFLTEDA